MAKKKPGAAAKPNQTNQRSLKAHSDALKAGHHTPGLGIVLKHEEERTAGESPAIVLREVSYKDLCDIGEKFLAFKWIAPSVLAADVSGAESDCEGKSCKNTRCTDPCVCDPATLRCVKISI